MKQVHRILLLNPPGKRLYLRDTHCGTVSKAYCYWPQIDILVQSGFLSKHFEINILDASILGFNEDDTIYRISQYKPDAIFCLTCALSWEEDKNIIERIKREIGSLIVGGGDILSFEGARIIKETPSLDAILIDFTSDILPRYFHGDVRGEAPNFIYKNNGKIYDGKYSPTTLPLKYPIPRHELIPLKNYRSPFFRKEGTFSVIYTSHGCPYNCSFCIAKAIKTLRLRDIDNILDELRYIKALKINKFMVRDALFTADRSHALQFCEGMITEGFNFEWICESRVDTIDPSLLNSMKKAGCSLISFGVESGNDEILKSVNKDINISIIRKAFKDCKEAGIRTGAHIILGLPGETENTILETIQFVIDLECDYVAFNMAVPRLGTKLRNIAIQEGWAHPDTPSIEKGLNIPTISQDKLWKLRTKALKRFYLRPSYILKQLLSIRSVRQIRESILTLISLLKEM